MVIDSPKSGAGSIRTGAGPLQLGSSLSLCRRDLGDFYSAPFSSFSPAELKRTPLFRPERHVGHHVLSNRKYHRQLKRQIKNY